MPSPPTLVYVLGVSRSGSTVLGSVLGAHAESTCVGEVAFTPQRGWREDRLCTCRERWDTCPVWTEVRRGLEERLGGFDVGTYQRLQRRFEPYPLDREGWNRLLRVRKAPTPTFRDYAAMATALLSSLAEATGKHVIVDSSKNPGRALALASIPGFDLRVVHVVRDARGVAFSMAKRFDRDVAKGMYHADEGESVMRSAALWSLVNGLSEVAARAVAPERRVRIRYEDFMRYPARTLADVGHAVGLDYGDVAAALLAEEVLPVGHMLNGNRMRMDGPVRLKADHEWERSLPIRSRVEVALGAGVFLGAYGYNPLPALPRRS